MADKTIPLVADVWVASRARSTPAHRIREAPGAPSPSRKQVGAHLVHCPPGVMFGGEVITRREAAMLSVHPCARCFEIRVQVPPTLRPPVHPDAGDPFRMPDGEVLEGYVVGGCGHRVARSEWTAGFRVCERC